MRGRLGGEAEAVDMHTVPGAAHTVLLMLAAAVIVAVSLVYFALGVADAD